MKKKKKKNLFSSEESKARLFSLEHKISPEIKGPAAIKTL